MDIASPLGAGCKGEGIDGIGGGGGGEDRMDGLWTDYCRHE